MKSTLLRREYFPAVKCNNSCPWAGNGYRKEATTPQTHLLHAQSLARTCTGNPEKDGSGCQRGSCSRSSPGSPLPVQNISPLPLLFSAFTARFDTSVGVCSAVSGCSSSHVQDEVEACSSHYSELRQTIGRCGWCGFWSGRNFKTELNLVFARERHQSIRRYQIAETH